ncbi:putative acyltransferase protein (plasmid) [Rhizobium etli CIAT 652]|uniref:Putative acyltransferase protein n=1 Tax=Rhizobium etli (strain CIAT 652) TaxID=491916 RepID=B3Q3R5_RHIE6|nr:putative acyltransferase protein [Rhizobium etli CIAT 652]
MMSDSTSRFIQMWRGIAVALVVLYHFLSRVPHEALGSAEAPILQLQIGEVGVLIFFVISGYLITKSVAKTTDVAAFYAKRLSRIWPLFIVSVITVFVFIHFVQPPAVLGPHSFFEKQPTVFDLLGNLFFLEDLGFTWVDGAYWSLVVELKFYLFIGLFAVAFKERIVQTFCSVALFMSSIDLLILLIDRTPGIPLGFESSNHLRFVSRVMHGLFISQYLPFFALGVAMAGRTHDGVLNALLALAVAFGVMAIRNDAFMFDQNVQFLFVLAVALLADKLLFQSAVVVWIGNYSYSIYLFHQVIGLALIKLFTPIMGIDLAIAASLGIVIAIAWLASVLFELRYRHIVAAQLYRIFSVVRLNRLTFHFRNEIPPIREALSSP